MQPLPTPTTAQAPTNLILYGPPGTGKSQVAAYEAVRLCDGFAPSRPVDLKARYTELVKAGQIRIVAFHPAYSYSDFVEGMRPAVTKAGIAAKPTPGVFREMASRAEQANSPEGYARPFQMEGRRVFKMTLGRAGFEDHIFEKAIAGNYIVLGWGSDIDWSCCPTKEAIANRWLASHPASSIHDAQVVQTGIFRVDMNEGDIVIISDGNHQFRAIAEITGPYQFESTGYQNYNHRRAVRWLEVPDESLPTEGFYKTAFQMPSCHELEEEHLDRDNLAQLLPGSQSDPANGTEQFVLICDDIDRADLASVFGEVLPLLDAERRIGAPGELRLTLPYSRQQFGLPSNLHIIGTMNGGNKDLEKLDLAAFRRFRFREQRPEPDRLGVVDGVDLCALLRRLNDRIEYLLGRDYVVGHGYLSPCTTKEEIDNVMRYQVIPLLVRHFHGDWDKLAICLGDPNGQYLLSREVIPTPGSAFQAENAQVENGATAQPERVRWLLRPQFARNCYTGLQ